MIKSWFVSRFKAVQEDVQHLEFKPLTIFAGTNSSGKSTVIQSILLTSQALYQQRDVVPLNGEIISLGTAGDVWHRGELSEPVILSGTFISDQDEVQFEVSLVPDRTNLKPDQDTPSATRLVVDKGSYSYHRDDTGVRFEYEIELDATEAGNKYFLRYLSPDSGIQLQERIAARGDQLTAVPSGSGVIMDRFLPGTIRVPIVRIATGEREKEFLMEPALRLQDLSEDERNSLFADDFADVIYLAVEKLNLPLPASRRQSDSWQWTPLIYAEWVDSLRPADKKRLSEFIGKEFDDIGSEGTQRIRTQSMKDISTAIKRNLADNLRYLSAYRIAPQALFTIDDVPIWSEVGINGTHIATALQVYGHQDVYYFDPETQQPENTPLIRAVARWLKHLQLLENVETNDLGKLGTFLSVQVAGLDKPLDLTAIGFGTSQVLPIIVQGLLTPRNGVFIIEQPEVHLHARVQSLLAYFFYGLTQTGRQCIVETHSEHIVNFLRALMAKPGTDFQDHVQIYFAKRDNKRGTSFQEVVVTNGHIKELPPGFMDESARLADMILSGIFDYDSIGRENDS